MAFRDLTGAVDFTVLDRTTDGDASVSEEVLGLFVQQAEMWRPMLDVRQDGWRDAAHTIRGAAAGIGAGDLAGTCQRAETAADTEAPGRLEAVRDALEAALADVAAYRHEMLLRSLKA